MANLDCTDVLTLPRSTFDYLREAIRTRGQLENAQKCVEGFRLDLKDATERSKEQQKLPPIFQPKVDVMYFRSDAMAPISGD